MWDLIERIKPTYYNCLWLQYNNALEEAVRETDSEVFTELEDLQHEVEFMFVNVMMKDKWDEKLAIDVVSNDIYQPKTVPRLTIEEIEKRIDEIGIKVHSYLDKYIPVTKYLRKHSQIS